MIPVHLLENISIPTPVKGVTHRHCRRHKHCRNFNSHPHEGGDVKNSNHRTGHAVISILTPVKGVTYRKKQDL